MRLKPIFMASLIAGLTICALPVFAAGAADFGRQQDDHVMNSTPILPRVFPIVLTMSRAVFAAKAVKTGMTGMAGMTAVARTDIVLKLNSGTLSKIVIDLLSQGFRNPFDLRQFVEAGFANRAG